MSRSIAQERAAGLSQDKSPRLGAVHLSHWERSARSAG